MAEEEARQFLSSVRHGHLCGRITNRYALASALCCAVNEHPCGRITDPCVFLPSRIHVRRRARWHGDLRELRGAPFAGLISHAWGHRVVFAWAGGAAALAALVYMIFGRSANLSRADEIPAPSATMQEEG